MKLEQTYITEQGLTADQVTSLETLTDTNEATLKLGWDDKANTDAEGIITGAVELATTKMGIAPIPREQGEKYGDWMARTTPLFIDSALAKEKQAVATKMQELEEKIKVGGDEASKAKYAELEGKYDLLQQQEAKFKDWEENDYKGKYETLLTDMSVATENIAFKEAKPNFPDTVNKFEADAKWNAFKADIKEKYTIQQDKEGNIVLTDKTNEHVKKNLADLVKADKTITELAAGRDYKGPGKDGKKIKIENVPFEVPVNATPKERTEAIRSYLIPGKYPSISSKGYSDEFAKLNQLILKQKNA